MMLSVSLSSVSLYVSLSHLFAYLLCLFSSLWKELCIHMNIKSIFKLPLNMMCIIFALWTIDSSLFGSLCSLHQYFSFQSLSNANLFPPPCLEYLKHGWNDLVPTTTVKLILFFLCQLFIFKMPVFF